MGRKKQIKPLVDLEKKFKDMYVVDCTNCLHYQTIFERITHCPKCRSSLHLKKVLY